MPATEYLRTAIGDHVLRNVAMTSPTNRYVALFTIAPTVEGGGTEVTGGSYERVAINFVTTATPGELENTSVTISDMPESDVVAIGIYDAVTSGNLLYFEPFATVSVAATESYPINVGVFTIRHI